jgi:hypothetical protein
MCHSVVKAFKTFAFIVLLFLTACGQVPAADRSLVASSSPTDIPSLSQNPVSPMLLPNELPPVRAALKIRRFLFGLYCSSSNRKVYIEEKPCRVVA